jgi:hypothetical protein
MKLDPEERAHQVCGIKGIDTIRREGKLPYGLQFKCDVTADQMKALTFTYEIGKEIPEDKWEDLGLWR